MIEKVVLDFLSDRLDAKVFIEKEPDMPTEYILIDKTGGGESNFIKKATITIQSYAASRARAAMLNETVKETMRDIIKLDEVSKCGLNTDYDYTDSSTKEYRYQAVFDIVHY